MSVDLNKTLPQSGYAPCACRDCMDTTVSSDVNTPELCSECEDAGCVPYGTQEGNLFPRTLPSAFDCQRDDAYDMDTDLDDYDQEQ